MIIHRHHEREDGTISEARFSEDFKYRYYLSRNWLGGNNKMLCFVMLNPSTADEKENDPTVHRCEQRARRGGYSGVAVLNLFALRSTDPQRLKSDPEPTGDWPNTKHLIDCLELAKKNEMHIICGWGTHGTLGDQDKYFLAWFDHCNIEPMCLGITKDGHPRHPLYLPYESVPIRLRT